MIAAVSIQGLVSGFIRNSWFFFIMRLIESNPAAAGNNELGTTLVEAVVVIPLFLVLFIASLELLRVSYYRLTLQYSVNSLARDVSVGYDSLSSDQLFGFYKTYNKRFALSFDKKDDVLTVCPLSSWPNGATCKNGTIATGTSKETLIITASKRVPLLFIPEKMIGTAIAGGELTLNAFTIVTNEPPATI